LITFAFRLKLDYVCLENTEWHSDYASVSRVANFYLPLD
jgi:hypothetical protein